MPRLTAWETQREGEHPFVIGASDTAILDNPSRKIIVLLLQATLPVTFSYRFCSSLENLAQLVFSPPRPDISCSARRSLLPQSVTCGGLLECCFSYHVRGGGHIFRICETFRALNTPSPIYTTRALHLILSVSCAPDPAEQPFCLLLLVAAAEG